MAEKLSKQEKQQQKEQEKFERERRKWKYKNSKKKKRGRKLDFTEIAIKTIAILAVVGILGGVAWIYGSNYAIPARYFTAITVGEQKVSEPEWSFYFYNQYSQYAQTALQYGQLASMLGLFDISQPLFGQEKGAGMGAEAEETAEKVTWDQFFTTQTNESLHDLLAAYQQAQKDGLKISKEDLKIVDDQMAELKKTAGEYGMTINAYLRLNYMPGMNEKKYREMMERDFVVQAFEAKKKEEYTVKYTDAELQKLYGEDTTLFDFVDYYNVPFAKTTLQAAEGETAEVLAERQKTADAAVKTEAEAFLVGATSEESFLAAVTALKQKEYQAALDKAAADKTEINEEDYDISKYDAAKETLMKHGRKTALTEQFTEENAKWFMGAKQGEVKLVETETSFFAIYVKNPAYQMQTREYYMIPVEATEEMAAEDVKAKAEGILEEWNAGEKTLASFKALADANISDEVKAANNMVDPGRVEKAIPGYEPEIDEWIFGSRKAGDTAIVEMQDGTAVVYFVGENKGDYSWKVELTSQGVQQDYEAYTVQLLKDYPMTEKKLGMDAALKTCERMCETFRQYALEQQAAQAAQQGGQGGFDLSALGGGGEVEAEADGGDHEGHDHE